MIKRKVCLLLLCGLPAAGKSTLSRSIKEKFPEICETDHRLIGRLEYVEYDGVMRDEQKDQTWTPEMWRSVRSDIIPRQVRQMISEAQNKDGLTIILLDDNFYYRSMRKMYFQMAQEYDAGFVQLFLDVDIPTTLQRNQERELRDRVPDDIIESMANKFEINGQAPWENHSIHISLVADVREISKSPSDDPSYPHRQIPWQDIFTMWSDLLPQNAIDEDEKNADRLMTAQNFLHRLDLALRRETSSIMTQCKTHPSAYPSPQDVAKTLNTSKKEIMAQIRSASDISEPDLLEIFYVQQFRASFHQSNLKST